MMPRRELIAIVKEDVTPLCYTRPQLPVGDGASFIFPEHILGYSRLRRKEPLLVLGSWQTYGGEGGWAGCGGGLGRGDLMDVLAIFQCTTLRQKY